MKIPRSVSGDRFADCQEGRESAEVYVAAADQGNCGVGAAAGLGCHDAAIIGRGGYGELADAARSQCN